jgi:hypothetical protein
MALPIPYRFTYPIAFAFDRRVDPSCLQVLIKVSKADPFRQGCTLGQGRFLPCVRSNRYSTTWRSGEVPTALSLSVPMAPP